MSISSSEFETALPTLRSAIEQMLVELTRPVPGCPERLSEAIRYSVLAPGKRLRPLLALLAAQAVSGRWEPALPVACAVELVHVYSLIHDDLPAMDNDDLRRGQPTNHRRFDEATAILAGDSLPMLAMEIICDQLEPEKAAACCLILARAAGRTALVGGQADDLAAEGRYGPREVAEPLQLEFLQSIHRRKTGAMIEASLRLGGTVADASPQQIEDLVRFGRAIGLAFQVVDDCLDVESTAEQLGKQTRKDSELGKLTYPGLLGLGGSRALAEELVEDACQALADFGPQAQPLRELARFVVERRR